MAPACCPPGSWPQLMETSNADLNKENAPAPKGSVTSIAVEGQDDLPLYVVEPEGTPKGTVLVVPDIYSVRVLIPEVRSGDRIGSICDALADQGYLVALAGIFRDKPFDLAVSGPDDGEFNKFDSFAADGGVDWFKSQGYEKVGPCLMAASAFLKGKAPDAKAFSAGFCFGSWAISKASATGDCKFDGLVGLHPTTILENAVFGRDEDAMMADLKQPTIFLWAGNDHPSYTGDGKNKIAVEATGGKVHEFPDQLHGWVSRGDVADPEVKKGVESALTIMKEFFESKL